MKSVDWEILFEKKFGCDSRGCPQPCKYMNTDTKKPVKDFIRKLLSEQKKEFIEMIGENEDTQCKDLNPKEHHMELNHVHRQGRNELRAELRSKLKVQDK